MFIYVIVNSDTFLLYVGQHKGDNLQKYLQRKYSAAMHREAKGSYLFNSMRVHPKGCWSIHPLMEVQTKAELDYWEKFYIKLFHVQDSRCGYNICRGGEGFTGPHTAATKEKLRLANLGKQRTEEQVQERRERAKREYAESPEYQTRLCGRGRYPSVESRKKMSDSHLGQSRPQTETQKQRIGESNSKTWTPERRAAQAAQMKKNFGS